MVIAQPHLRITISYDKFQLIHLSTFAPQPTEFLIFSSALPLEKIRYRNMIPEFSVIQICKH